MNLDQLLTDSGLPTNSLSPDVKAAMDRVLQTAGYKALQEVLALLNVQATQKNGGTPTNGSDIDAKAVKDALAEIEARNKDKDNRKKVLYYVLGGFALLGTIVTLLLVGRHRKH